MENQKCPYLITPSSVVVHISGKQYSVNNSHPEFQRIIEYIKSGNFDGIVRIMDKATTITESSGGKLLLDNGVVYHNGNPVNNYVVNKIVEFIGLELDFKPLLNFLERLLANPSKRAVDELYKFLEHEGFPIGEDGCFYGYKGVGSDYLDKHSHSIDNHPGCKPKVDRNTVCDDKDIGCSGGLHVGTYEYAIGYACGCDDKVVLVKVDPADVVSIPTDCNFQKLRCCEYEVIEDCTGKIGAPVYKPTDLPFDELDDDELDDDEYEEWLDLQDDVDPSFLVPALNK